MISYCNCYRYRYRGTFLWDIVWLRHNVIAKRELGCVNAVNDSSVTTRSLVSHGNSAAQQYDARRS